MTNEQKYDCMTTEQVDAATMAEWLLDEGFAAYVRRRRSILAEARRVE